MPNEMPRDEIDVWADEMKARRQAAWDAGCAFSLEAALGDPYGRAREQAQQSMLQDVNRKIKALVEERDELRSIVRVLARMI